MSYFNDSDWVVGYIDVEYGIIEVHNIYNREKIYMPLPDQDELEAWAMNVLALMRRAYDKGREEERRRRLAVIEGGKGSQGDLRPVASAAGDHQEPDSRTTEGEA